jgi:hypothetical protein
MSTAAERVEGVDATCQRPRPSDAPEPMCEPEVTMVSGPLLLRVKSKGALYDRDACSAHGARLTCQRMEQRRCVCPKHLQTQHGCSSWMSLPNALPILHHEHNDFGNAQHWRHNATAYPDPDLGALWAPEKSRSQCWGRPSPAARRPQLHVPATLARRFAR